MGTRTLKVNKPGQFMIYRDVLYRATRAHHGCSGCALNGMFSCPNVKYANAQQEIEVACRENLIIFVRV